MRSISFPSWHSKSIITLIGFVLLYIVITQLSVAYFAPRGFVAIIWPASGLALAAVLRGGKPYLWALFIAATVSYTLLGRSLGATVVLAFGTTLEAYLGLKLLTQNLSCTFKLDSMQEVVQLILSAGFVACVPSALIGTSSILFDGLITHDDYLTNALQWWMGDVLGIILITPFLLVGLSATSIFSAPKRLAEALFLLCLTGFVSQSVFKDVIQAYTHFEYRNYWLFLLVTWAALRFGLRGSVSLLLAISVLGLQGIQHLQPQQAENELIHYWFFMVILAVVGNLLAIHLKELTQTKNALQESKAATQYALNQLTYRQYAVDQHAIVAITDLQGTIIYVNQKFCQISGYRDNELMGQNHRLLNSGHHPPEFFQTLYRIISHGQVWHGEICNRRQDRELYWVDTTIVPIYNEQCQLHQYIAIRTDITERKRAEAALQESQFVLQEAQHVARIGHYITDLYSGCWESSHVFDDIFGLTPDFEKTFANWVNIVHPDFIEDMFETYFRAIDEKTRFEQTYKITRPANGKECWIAVSGICYYDEQNNPIRFIGTAQDITEIKLARDELEQHRDHLQEMVAARTEELLVAKVTAEQANQAKTQFLSNMSHELRTPIHAILSFSQLGQEKSRAHDVSISKLQHYFEYINQSGQRLLPLVNDLLDLSSLESGKMRFTFAEHDLGQLIQTIVRENQLLVSRRQISINSTAIQTPLFIHCDAAKIGQVVLNLLDNACKFSPEGSTVTLASYPTQLQHAYPDAEEDISQPALAVDIIDQGIGIPPSELDVVFDQFMQSSKTRSTAGGTGLGLAISRQIINGHGGSIQAFNNPEGGCRFTVVLPLVVDSNAPRLTPARNSSATDSTREYDRRQVLLDNV